MTRSSRPVKMHVTYRPKPGKEADLLALVKQHWPILDRLGLVTKEPATVYRARDTRSGRAHFVEIFSWKDGEASGIAHTSPQVMAIWEPMEVVLETLELAEIEPVDPTQ